MEALNGLVNSITNFGKKNIDLLIVIYALGTIAATILALVIPALAGIVMIAVAIAGLVLGITVLRMIVDIYRKVCGDQDVQ